MSRAKPEGAYKFGEGRLKELGLFSLAPRRSSGEPPEVKREEKITGDGVLTGQGVTG